MERGPLMDALSAMIGTDVELSIILWGEDKPIEIRDVEAVEELKSSHGLRVTTGSNYIWIDASHVSAAWQARSDI